MAQARLCRAGTKGEGENQKHADTPRAFICSHWSRMRELAGNRGRQDQRIGTAHESRSDVQRPGARSGPGQRARAAARTGHLHERTDDDRRSLLAHERRELEAQRLAGPRPGQHEHVLAPPPRLQHRLLPRVQRPVPELVQRAPQLHVPARVRGAAAGVSSGHRASENTPCTLPPERSHTRTPHG